MKAKIHCGCTDALSAKAEYHEFGDDEWMPKMIASGTLPVLVEPSMIDGRRKFDGGVDPLPVRKAYELGAKRIIVIRTYEENLREN